MKKAIAALIILYILSAAFPVIGKAAEVQMIEVPFYSAGMWDMKWEFPYSDSYFLGSQDEFSRDLAKASLGLTASAIRAEEPSALPNQYETYLGAAGFQDIYAFGYDKPTAPDTLSGVIASKKIDDFTLIAVSPCGQGYVKEWGGNLNLGNGERHEGFDIAAQILERELFSYMEEQNLTGKLKLWITSFSRGSAVSNLAAADLIESDRFEAVYAYLYAVPRTTKNAYSYPNIYNICGAYDPITQIPFESWGYFRNGWDLYLPSAETDAEYDQKLPYVDEVTRSVAHDRFRYNPELNYELHLIMKFLGEMFPSPQEYTAKMQEEVMGLWTEANPDQMFQILESVFASLDDLDRRQEYSREIIIDYLEYLASLWLKDKRNSGAQRDLAWAEGQEIAPNLMREHMPYIYLSWIFSDLTDDQLFRGSFSTQRLSVIGDVDVEIWQDNVFLNGMDQNGEPIVKEQSSDEMLPQGTGKRVFTVRNGLTTMVLIPANGDYQVRIIKKDSTGFHYRADTCYLPATYGTSDGYYVAVVTPGIYELDFFKYIEKPDGLKAVEGTIQDILSRDRAYSPTLAMKIQLDSEDHLTVSKILVDLILLLSGVLALLLICLIIAIVHKAKKKDHGPYSPWYVIVPHWLLVLLFVWLTIYFTRNLYLIPYTRIGAATAGGIVLCLLSLRGLIRNRNLPNLLILAGMLAALAVNVFIYQRSEIVGRTLFVNLIYCAVMAALALLAAGTFWVGRQKRSHS